MSDSIAKQDMYTSTPIPTTSMKRIADLRFKRGTGLFEKSDFVVVGRSEVVAAAVRREDLRAWTASGFEVCSSNLAAAKINELNTQKRLTTFTVVCSEWKGENHKKGGKNFEVANGGSHFRSRFDSSYFQAHLDPESPRFAFPMAPAFFYEREKNEGNDGTDCEQVGAGTSKRTRTTSANSNALKLSCELLRIFITEAVQRSAMIAEAEGAGKIEGTHLERILPQLLLDF
ncbi:hypothetical protein DKX38_018755 [Salix brachista]|uniref:Centromere protein X n=1 Tax=Salix brachista TaxID=2182728 RepID=A0A5N5KNW1_9ROSI|nr:hypothetical protein DKX38_018755 [Salix brachista]